ncbi:hypothetical protein U91I_02071 [alpha proteobacterium U9-1i]|nr:hypothetical protein U91I_02071 [alpha proteobacterium U9-1i]
MPNTATFDTAASTALTMLGRALALAAVFVGLALLAVFTAAAAMVAGLLVLGAVIAMRFAPKAQARGGPETLNAHRTPDGWVVETRLR